MYASWFQRVEARATLPTLWCDPPLGPSFWLNWLWKVGCIRGFLFPELGFATLVITAFPLSLSILSKKPFRTYSNLCPEISTSKLGCPFGLARLKVFCIHLNPGNKTALWTILIQANLCDRMSSRPWKPDWNLISKDASILGSHQQLVTWQGWLASGTLSIQEMFNKVM
jgi:hypothetical protein